MDMARDGGSTRCRRVIQAVLDAMGRGTDNTTGRDQNYQEERAPGFQDVVCSC